MGIEIVGEKQAQARLELTVRRFTPAVRRAVVQSANLAMAHMKDSYLSGRILRVQTGKLRSNWQVRVRSTDRETSATVGTNTVYARAQNYGYKGAVTVKAHTRRRRASRSAPRRGGRVKQLRARSEARAAGEHRSRRNREAFGSHGLSRRALDVQKLGERRARGIQAGVFGPGAGGSVRRRLRGEGRVFVRAHGRFMKLRGKFYVERTLRDVAPTVRRLIQQAQLSARGLR